MDTIRYLWETTFSQPPKEIALALGATAILLLIVLSPLLIMLSPQESRPRAVKVFYGTACFFAIVMAMAAFTLVFAGGLGAPMRELLSF